MNTRSYCPSLKDRPWYLKSLPTCFEGHYFYSLWSYFAKILSLNVFNVYRPTMAYNPNMDMYPTARPD